MKLKSYISAAVPALALLIGAASCQDDTEKIDNSIFAPVADTSSTINVKPTTGTVTGYVEACIAKKTDTDVEVTFSADESRVAVYNDL